MSSSSEICAPSRPGQGATASPKALILPLAIAACLALLVVNSQTFETISRMDFAAFYSAALMVHGGKARSLYDPNEQIKVEKGVVTRERPFLITHPPYEAVFSAPLARFSLVGAYKVWGIFNIGLWLLFCLLTFAYAPISKRIGWHVVACFGFAPAWIALIDGENSLLIMFIYALAFLALRRRWEFLAGALLGFGLVKFQLVLPFVLIFLLRRKWRLCAGFAVVAFALGGISVVAVGLSGVSSYIRLLLGAVKNPENPAFSGVLPRDFPSLRGWLDTILAGTSVVKWTKPIVAAVSLALLWMTASFWRRHGNNGKADWENSLFALAVAVTLMTSFHLNYYDLCLMILPIILVLASVPWKVRPPWPVVLALSMIWLYMPFQVTWAFGVPHAIYTWFLPLAMFAMSLVIILAKSMAVATVEARKQD